MPTVRTDAGIAVEISATPPRRGGESAVYLADGPLGPCVVKVALVPLPFGAWLESERALLTALGDEPMTSGLVPRVLGGGLWDERPFVVLERFARTLEEEVAAQPGSAQRLALAIRVAACVCALQAARPGLVHRDLKPSNLLVDGDRMGVTDFGIARENPGRSTTTRARFTPEFAAPEQALPHRVAEPSWDVFGLAATVYAVLVGAPAEAPARNAWRHTPRGLSLRAGRDDGRGEPHAYLDFPAMEALSRSDLARLDAVVRGPIRRALLAALTPDPRQRRGSSATLLAALRASSPGRRRAPWPWAVGLAAASAAALLAWASRPAPADYPVVVIPGADGVASFLLGEHEVTQRVWRGLMGDRLETRRRIDTNGLGPSCETFEGVPLVGDDLPMTCVSFLDALHLANRMSERDGLTRAYAVVEDEATGAWTADWDRAAAGWRLPTRDEWRRAVARPGGVADPCSENVADRNYRAVFPHAPFDDCDDGYTGPAPVGRFAAGPHGLRDGYGNVAEWTWDGDAARRHIGGGAWTAAMNRTPDYPLTGALEVWTRNVGVGVRLARNP